MPLVVSKKHARATAALYNAEDDVCVANRWRRASLSRSIASCRNRVESGAAAQVSVEHSAAERPPSDPSPTSLLALSATPTGTLWGRDANAVWRWGLEPPWIAVPDPGGPALAVGAASDGTVLAIPQTFGQTIRRYQQSQWVDVLAVPAQFGRPQDVSVGSAQNIWVCTSKGDLLRLASAGWVSARLPNGAAAVGVWACSDGTCWALGIANDLYRCVVSADVATAWTRMTSGIHEVVASLAGFIWVRNSDQWYQWDNLVDEWAARSSPPAQLVAMACGDDGSVFAATKSALYCYDGAGDRWIATPAVRPGAAISHLSVGTAAQIWLVDAGERYRYDAGYDPAYGWQMQRFACTSLATVGDREAWLVTPGNQLLRNVGPIEQWNPQPVGSGWSSVAAAGDGTVWAINSATGDPNMRAGENWIPAPRPAGVTFTMLAVQGAAAGYGLSSDGVVYVYYTARRAWSQLPSYQPGGGVHLVQISVSPEGAVFGLDSLGALLIFLGLDAVNPWLRLWGDIRISWVSSAGWADCTWVLTAERVVRRISFGDSSERVSAQRSRADAGAPGWEVESVFDETKSTHLWILNRAALLAEQDGGAVGTQIGALVKPFRGPIADEPFHNRLFEGLHDADYVSPWDDELIPGVHETAFYTSHFFDPDTGTNWLGRTSPTAVERGASLANEAIDYYIAGELGEAGYRLGLAMHYATDLTQPMHSSNRSQFSSWLPFWHRDFEKYVMAQQTSIREPAIYKPPPPQSSLRDLLFTIAKTSKPLLPLVWPADVTSGYGIKMSKAQAIDAVKDNLAVVLGSAVSSTASFLTRWMALANGTGSDAPRVIIGPLNGLVVETRGENPSGGDPVQQWLLNGGGNQLWALESLTGADAGTFRIALTGHEFVMDVVKSSRTAGAEICVWPWKTSDNGNQKWRVHWAGGRGFWFQNVGSGLALTGTMSNRPGGVLTQQEFTNTANQRWYMEQFVPSRIAAVNRDRNGKLMVADLRHSTPTPGGVVQAFAAWGHPPANQKWLLVEIDEPPDGEATSVILSLASGLALDSGRIGSGPLQVLQQAWTGELSQRWRLLAQVGQQTFVLANAVTGGVMTLANTPPANEDPVLLAFGSAHPSGPGQQWVIAPSP